MKNNVLFALVVSSLTKVYALKLALLVPMPINNPTLALNVILHALNALMPILASHALLDSCYQLNHV